MTRTKEEDPMWMVAYRTFNMPGGVIDYGAAQIVDFFNSFDDADDQAKEVFESHEGEIDLRVWILRCEKTYCNAGVIIERGLDRK